MGRIWWLWLPLGFLTIQFIADRSLPQDILVPLHSENGPYEMLQFFVIAAALVLALKTLVQMDRKKNKWLTCWIGLAAVCCFYVAGEEISWGQHMMEWGTPEFWAGLNDQNETNLHNTSSWLDQKPRLLLEIGVLFAGIIIPLLQKYKPSLVPERFNQIYAPSFLWVIAAICVFAKSTGKIGDLTGFNAFVRESEVVELYLYYFVFLYMITMKKRLTSEN